MTRIRLPWVACAYLALYSFGFLSNPVFGAAAIWPAHALSFAVFVLLPIRRWPGIALVLICCDFLANPLLSRLSGLAYHDFLGLLGLAFANLFTAVGPAVIARVSGLLQSEDRYQLVVSPLWLVALLVGVAPGALLGAATRAHDAGAPIEAADFGLWVLAAVLAIVTMGPAIFGMVLGFSAPAKAAAKPWEGWAISVGVVALFLWFVLAPWPAADVLVEPMLFTIPLAWLALRFSQRTTSIAVAVVAAGISVLGGHRTGGENLPANIPAWSDVVISIDVFLLIGCGGALLVNLMTLKQRALLEELAREHAQLRQYAQALDSAEEAARRHTAADLHDGIGQVLAGQSMTLSAMRAHANQPKLAALIEEAVEASREAQEGLRLMIQDLSPPELEHASLEEMLKWLAELFKTRFGFTIAYQASGGTGLDQDHLQLVYRCIRELSMNACKHSGRPAASVEVRVAAGWVWVTVLDDGVGFDAQSELSASKGRFGLAQLRERVRAAGGTVSLTSAAGGGCRVTVRLPL
ncbi:MAG TPA: ATP-binding protein [Steroidobacteraceae bacterium]